MNSLIKISSMMIPAAALAAMAQDNLINRIGWQGATPAMIIGISAVFAAGITVLITIYANNRRKHINDAREVSRKHFRESCAKCRLTDEEVAILRKVAAYAPDADVDGHRIFEKQAIFEYCVDAYVNNSRAVDFDTDDLLGVVRKKLGFGTLPSELPLMSTRNISTGQPVTVFADRHPAAAMAAKITHVGELFFTARLAEEFRDDHGLKLGASATVSFLRHGDAAYNVTAKIQDAAAAATSGDVSFYHEMKFARKQNRKYLRLDVSLQIKYRILESPSLGKDEKPPPETRTAHTVDIGGGGLCFSSETPLRDGDIIMLTLIMPGRPMGGIKAKILRVMQIVNSTTGDIRYKHLVQFTSIETPQREFIVKFIFEKQREMLQMR